MLMEPWSDSPVVSFSRAGTVFELGRGPDDPVLHLYGSTGLGLAPVSISSSDRLTGDGSIVRGVRYDKREVFIPLLIEAESVAALSRTRRTLTSLLAPHNGVVEVRVQDPATGSDRMIRGYLREGLEGDFGDGFYGSWQTLGLTFECPDPWWMGPERMVELRVDPGSKAFLSEGRVSRRNLVPNPFGNAAGGVEYWRRTRGTLSMLGVDGLPAARFVKNAEPGQGYIDPSINFRPPPESTLRFSADVMVGSDLEMRLRVAAYDGAAPGTGDAVPQSPSDGWVRHEVVVPVSAMPEGGSFRTLIWPTSMAAGQEFWVRRVLVEIDTTGEYFDGDTPGCKWVGGSDGPESIMWDPAATTPFFPIVLAQSTVVGRFEVDVGGVGATAPVWEITGPGRDLVISNGTDRIEILGEFPAGEVTVIDAISHRITPDRWEDVSLDSRLFQLEPGRQTITASLVEATTDTVIRLGYRERYLEGV